MTDVADGAETVWITGIGLVSSLGEGREEHWNRLAADTSPVLDGSTFAPYSVHPLVDIDYSVQIPRRADQRQAGPWQRLGVYAAGLALSDAGIAGNAEYLGATDMIVAAGGGERDVEVDATLLELIGTPRDTRADENQVLLDSLRPTLFLAELSNLLAGNISIVHGVTGSSRTFMGEEMAGVSAVQVAAERIKSRQGDLFLVGAAFNAERDDTLLLYELGHCLWGSDFESVWSRRAKGGGMITGSVGAFLVLESKSHALARNARPHACISRVGSDRCNRNPGQSTRNAEKQFDDLCGGLSKGPLAVLSGASGVEPAMGEEFAFFEGLENRGFDLAIRTTGTVLGHSFEAQFPSSLALAAMAVSKGAFYDPFDESVIERAHRGRVDRALITTWGSWRGESIALLETATTEAAPT